MTTFNWYSYLCHNSTNNFPNSQNLIWWHIFKQPNESRIIVMYAKLRNRTYRPLWLKAGVFLLLLHRTKYISMRSSSLYSQTINGTTWFSCCGRNKMFIFYIWLRCRLFDILDMPFSLQYIKRLYLTLAGIYPFCFKDYPANRMSTCFHCCIVKEKKSAANADKLCQKLCLWNPCIVSLLILTELP